MDRPGTLVDSLDRIERHEDAPPRGKEATRRDQDAGHHPAFVLEAEIRGASDFSIRRHDPVAEDVVAVAGEIVERRKPAEIGRAAAPPVGLPALC